MSNAHPPAQAPNYDIDAEMDAIVARIMSLDDAEVMLGVTDEDIARVKSTIAEAIEKAGRERLAAQAPTDAEAIEAAFKEGHRRGQIDGGGFEERDWQEYLRALPLPKVKVAGEEG